jgi:hypothetical protein
MTAMIAQRRIQLAQLAPGVLGAIKMDGPVLEIVFITAEHEGSGDVGRYLDGLECPVRIPCVLSPRLRGMLQRRGFTVRTEFDAEMEDTVEIWERSQSKTTGPSAGSLRRCMKLPERSPIETGGDRK